MDSQKGYLLIVEDVPDILRLLEETLKWKGYWVVTARNGQEALEIIQKEPPALIMADIMMPKIDGFSLLYRLRSKSETQAIPVIFVTATYVSLEDRAFAMELGATRFIEKPVHFEKLLSAINELLQRTDSSSHKLLSDVDFYKAYIQRLEMKLRQKIAQIARDERLLATLSEEEKSSFRFSLQMAINEREALQRLIQEMHDRFSNAAKTDYENKENST